MAMLREIVEGLNREPFNKGLSLVTFDEKSPQDLLQTLNDVMTVLDSAHDRDVRDEPPEMTGSRIANFLTVLKYPMPADTEAFQRALAGGERGAVYPALHYILSKFPQLQKRAYLAKFLMSVDVPAEFLHDEAIQEVHAQYKELQEEFKETHKTADRLKTNSLAPGELRREIAQLTEERTQLSEKIKGLQRKTTGMAGFKELLDATSALRKEQEEETKLQERMHDQRVALSTTEKRLAEAARRLGDMRAADREDVPPERILENARRENEENRRIATESLPEALGKRQETLDKLLRALREPAKTEDDMFHMKQEAASLQADIDRLQAEIAEANRRQGDDKLALFRQQYAMISKKLQEQEGEVERASQEGERLAREIQSKEAKISEMSGPKFMKREEFKAYAAQLRQKTNQFKSMKAELAAVRQELVVLSRTEHILRSRDHNLEEFMKQMEAKKGIEGYTTTEARLAELSSLKATVDDLKGKTLTEISRIVTDINQALKERKNKLSPQIKELRAVRLQYQELESSYLMAKGTYDSTAAGLEAERSKLEQECDALQEDCLREESQYHQLTSNMAATQCLLERVEEEAKFDAGEGRLLPNFPTWKKLYENKVAQQQQLSNQLRRRQKEIKENAGTNMEQRKMFVDLRKLVQLKLKLTRDSAKGAATGMEDHAAEFDEIGGADVMTLGQ